MADSKVKRKIRQVSLHAASTILWREMRVLWRSKFSELMVTIASPLTFFLALGLGLSEYVNEVEGRPYFIFMAPGLISMAAVTYAFSDAAWSLWFHRRHQRTIDAYRVNPISVYDIVLGEILSGFVSGAVRGVVVAAIILPLSGMHLNWPYLGSYLIFIIFGSMLFSCAGTIAGTLLNKPEQIARFDVVIITPLVFLSGLFFPISDLPQTLQSIVRLLPTTAVFEAARQAMLTGHVEKSELASLVISAALMFILAVRVFEHHAEE